ncbi:MAG: hypothetical protein K6E78_07730 [Treponema sp.]|nr:hypothetical protein [Treponema sp.]
MAEEKKTDSEVGENKKIIKNFFENLENGVSVVQLQCKEPHYMKNFLTGKVPQGNNQLALLQGAYNNDVKGTLFVTRGQMDSFKDEKGINNPLFSKKGSHSIGTMTLKKDAEQLEKDKARGDNTEYNFAFCFAAEDVVYTRKETVKDDNGKDKLYEDNVFSKDQVYEKDREPYMQDGKVVFTPKKGEPVLLHLKGTKMYSDPIATDKALVPSKINHLPALNDGELYALPKVKDSNNPYEVLQAGMAKFFRGVYNGNGEGWRPSSSEIKSLKQFSLEHPKLFYSAISQADTYGRGNTKECAEMEKNIAAARAKNENKQQNSNTENNDNKKSAKKGRS